MADVGVQPHVIEQILNHVSGHKGGVAGIYNRSSYTLEVRNALGLWAARITALAEGRDPKVIAMRLCPWLKKKAVAVVAPHLCLRITGCASSSRLLTI